VTRNLLEKVLELFHAALWPTETAFSVPQIGHYESVFPRTVSGAGTTQVAWWRRTIVNTAEPEKELILFEFGQWSFSSFRVALFRVAHFVQWAPKWIWWWFSVQLFIQFREFGGRQIWRSFCNRARWNEIQLVTGSNCCFFVGKKKSNLFPFELGGQFAWICCWKWGWNFNAQTEKWKRMGWRKRGKNGWPLAKRVHVWMNVCLNGWMNK